MWKDEATYDSETYHARKYLATTWDLYVYVFIDYLFLNEFLIYGCFSALCVVKKTTPAEWNTIKR